MKPISLVILVQSTNFRITDFRIRLELFQYGIHCIEHNHLGYYPDEQVTTYIRALQYRTPAYIEATKLHIEASGNYIGGISGNAPGSNENISVNNVYVSGKERVGGISGQAGGKLINGVNKLNRVLFFILFNYY